jgi:hypothetical protein
MIEIITNRILIAQYQKQFIKQLRTICNDRVICRFGYQGNSDEVTAYYSNKFNFGFTSSLFTEANNRYWNAFVFGKPLKGKNNDITVEINSPFEGINRRIGGAFGKDNNGNILVLHRGKIGGGKIGIGKHLFFEKFTGARVNVSDDQQETEFAVVAVLNSRQFSKQVSDFVQEVNEIKNLQVEEIDNFSFLNNFYYTDESSGKRKAPEYSSAEFKLYHGIVVRALKRALIKKGLRVANDRYRDLFTYKKSEVKNLFEIKVNSSPEDIYRAVGQLLIYSIPFKKGVGLIMVMPKKLKNIVENRINKYGIKIMYYSWEDDKPKFKNLEDFIIP